MATVPAREPHSYAHLHLVPSCGIATPPVVPSSVGASNPPAVFYSIPRTIRCRRGTSYPSQRAATIAAKLYSRASVHLCHACYCWHLGARP